MLKGFKIGGVHPADNKITRGKIIEVMPVPATAVISLAQHLGAPAEAIVKKGDEVKVGQQIGKAKGFISANIHSSVSGVVKSVDAVRNAMGLLVPSVTVEVSGDEWMDTIDRSEDIVSEITMSAEDIVKRVAEAGIVGLGGATFPTNVKLMVPDGKKAVALVVNGVECEPYLTSDHRLMLENSQEIVIGIRILCRALNVDKAYVGIENNKQDAIVAMRKASQNDNSIEIVPLRVMYPQGGEKQLIDAVMNRQVPSGALPIEVGAVVQNVGTVYAVYQAVQKNKPLFERVVTVTGKSVKDPKNLLVRVGTPVQNLIDYCGGLPEDTAKVIDGGPMMGRSMANLDGVVNKGSSGVLMLNCKDTLEAQAGPCIKCAKCVSVCPMGLEPYLINAMADKRMFEDIIPHDVMDCIECGSCSFTCPANIRLLDNIRLAKREAGKILRSRK